MIISKKHPQCDLDHRVVSPWQQRPHLVSGYTMLVGEALGLDSVTSAKSDRFLELALAEIGEVDPNDLLQKLKSGMSLKSWLQLLIADINNQAEDADRLIGRDCIFKWVRDNMSLESALSIFYDEDRQSEY